MRSLFSFSLYVKDLFKYKNRVMKRDVLGFLKKLIYNENCATVTEVKLVTKI